jgi:hypothetical protein
MDNNKMDLREIGWDGVDWIDMAQDRDKFMITAKEIYKNIHTRKITTRIATVFTPNGLRSRAALTLATNDEPWSKKNFYEPQVETKFGNRFPAGHQASSPKRVLLQTAQTKLLLSPKTGIRGRKVG